MAEPENRQEAITNFKEVCAVDDARAEQFLSHCDFNLERAVQLFFQTGGVLDNTNEGFENERNWENELRRRAGPASNASTPAAARAPAAPASANGRNRNAVGVRQLSWLEWLFAVAALPLNFFVSTLQDVFEGIMNIFGAARGTPEVTDPRGDVARFIATYEERIVPGVQSRLTFSPEAFMEACQRAKRELRALLVFLHDDASPESAAFLRDTLSSQHVATLITANNILLWGASTATPEGQRVARQLRTRNYPQLCLMTVRDGRMITSLRLSSMPVDRLANNLSVGINMIDMHLRQLRAAQLRREEDSRIRAEQEAEYREALAADRAKKEEKERKVREAEEKLAAAKRAEEERDECRRIIEEKRDELRAMGCGEAEVEGDAVRVQIRFPSGEKMERKFALDEAVESLFNAAISARACPLLFSLHTNYPRRCLPYVPEWYAEWRARAFPDEQHETPPTEAIERTFREESLTQSLVVMVQDEAS